MEMKIKINRFIKLSVVGLLGLQLSACFEGKLEVRSEFDPRPTTWYKDADADTFGNPSTKFVGDQPDNTWVSNQLDCDDTRAAINPHAPEARDLADNDCDGSVDEGLAVYIFVTSQAFAANFGALTNADNLCQTAAQSGTSKAPPGVYKAWISNSSENAADRINRSTIPYYNTGLSKVADDWNDLTDGSIDSRVLFNENGVIASSNFAMTGTSVAAVSFTNHCSNWSVADASSVAVGSSNESDNKWTFNSTGLCSNQWHLYCIQQ